jgi:phospholipid/cholesterol/gamma-HCH transport system ATP-binding protein
MIEVKNIKKTFGDKTIIDDVSVKMEPGKCNLVIGSSGSGKTVFMKCLVGLFVPDAGEILYQGHDFIKMNGLEKKKRSVNKSECCSRGLRCSTV